MYLLPLRRGDVIIRRDYAEFQSSIPLSWRVDSSHPVDTEDWATADSFPADADVRSSGLELDLDRAWALTRSLSPRDVVRVASIVAHDGTIANDYDRELSVLGRAPSTPWAMYLSGDRQRYDFLAFDLDVSRGNAVRDAGRLSLWLDELRIDHLITESGPTGGRHVWIALDEPTDAAVVRELALLARDLLPSLDVTPLLNPIRGCVRPPGAVHRFGGVSRPLGALSSLLTQRADAESIDDLRAFLLDSGAELPAPTPPVRHGVTATADGHPYVPGDRRDLSPKVLEQLSAPMMSREDASARLVSVLAAMANAHWQFSDLAPYLQSSPAFEHVRTERVRASRVPRTAKRSRAVLEYAWRYAVEYVAANPAAATDDVDGAGYLSRLTDTVQAVQALQERADTMPGLWGADRASQGARARRGTYSRRAVLDALCLFMVQAASATIEADCRRLALHIGYGKTTTADALRELATPLVEGDPESAWIVRVGEAEGKRGRRYRLSERFSTGNRVPNRTLSSHIPPSSPLPLRDRWFRELGSRLEILNEDVFAAPHSLGRHAGNVYRHLLELPVDVPLTIDGEGNVLQDLTSIRFSEGTDVAALAHRTGLSRAQVRLELDKLVRVWLAVPLAAGWARPPKNQSGMRVLALHLDVDGYLEDRATRYRYERERWDQWLNQVTWIHQTDPNGRRRPARPDSTAVPLFESATLRGRDPKYPRKPDGSWDHSAALRLIAARSAA